MEERHLRVLLRWLWLLLLIPAITGASGLFYALSQDEVYRAVTRLIIGPGIDSPNPSLDSLRTGALLMQTYAELAETESFRQEALSAIGLDIPTADLADIVSLRPVVDTQIVNVVVEYTDPDIAVRLANQIADQMVALSPSAEYNSFLRTRIQEQADRLEEGILDTETRLTDLRTELDNETDPNRQGLLAQRIAEEEAGLSDANAALSRIYDTLQEPFTNQVEIVDRAHEALPVSSEIALFLMVSVVTGALVSAMLAMLFIFLDMMLVDYESLRRSGKYPIWGRVRQNSEAITHSDLRIVSTVLIHQNQQHGIKSLLLMGIEDSAHVANLACELAATLSHTGKKVLLVDADFSNTHIAEHFHLENAASLIDALTGDIVKSNIGSVEGHPNLTVIPSGETSADAFYLIASPRLQRIMSFLKERADFIIISAPVLSYFEQSLAMASWADGALIVAKQSKTRVADLDKAIGFLQSVGGAVKGLVISA
jgi:capsular polysaccharide biosynthesis protein